MVNEVNATSRVQRRHYATMGMLLFLAVIVLVGMNLLHTDIVPLTTTLEASDFEQALQMGNARETASGTRHRRDTEVFPQIDEPLNIVLFYADDWTMKVMGKLNKDVITPNIDKLADEGVLFTNNCVTTSMCWISRGSLVTGTYASRHNFVHPGQETLFHSHPWNETLFPLLRSHGYYTGIVGKWHAPQPEPYMSQAFDWKNLYFGYHWESVGGEMRHVTDLNLEDSLEFLKVRPKDKNFALMVSFFATHAWDDHVPSYEPKNESKRKFYNDIEIPVPYTSTPSHWAKMPYFFTESNEGRRRWRGRFDGDNYQQNIKDLYRMATEVDIAVGRIIQELKSQGVYNNTLLIFTTDNGNMHGEHGLAEKWFPYEESIRVPLVIVDPRMPRSRQGQRNDDWTLNIDLAPTMLRAAKITPSSFMQGRDISKLYLYRRIRPRWRQDWFYEYNRGHPITAEGHNGAFWIDASFALVTKEWKYIHWPEHGFEQVFHRINDPFEERDMLNASLIKTTDEVLLKLRARFAFLKEWVQSGKPA
eukprot:Nitzschia sp. Nitz4//scaffold341_size29662//449//2044//NITZ4_008033-RA/size29662-processed-gene-0.25-mRNA-1//-1//CDS//3329548531//443//frame0